MFYYSGKREEYFAEMDDAYRQKQFPKGFLASQVKRWKKERRSSVRGIALIVLWAVVSVGWFVYTAYDVIVKGIPIRGSDLLKGGEILLGSLFVAYYISVFRGKKDKVENERQIVREYAKNSGLGEWEIDDFARQIMEPETRRLWFRGDWKATQYGDTGIMTRDFIWFARYWIVFKKSDIKIVCLYESPFRENYGDGKFLYNLWVDLIADKDRVISAMIDKEAVDYLVEYIRECNPDVDTLEGRVLKNEEHEEFMKTLDFRLW